MSEKSQWGHSSLHIMVLTFMAYEINHQHLLFPAILGVPAMKAPRLELAGWAEERVWQWVWFVGWDGRGMITIETYAQELL